MKTTDFVAEQRKAVAAVLSSMSMKDPFEYQVGEFAKIWPPYGTRVKRLRDLAEKQILVYRRKAGSRPYWILGPHAMTVLSEGASVEATI